jgi:hypothetical protein
MKINFTVYLPVSNYLSIYLTNLKSAPTFNGFGGGGGGGGDKKKNEKKKEFNGKSPN